MRKTQEREMVADITIFFIGNERIRGIRGRIGEAAPWLQREIIRHERAHVPVVGNFYRRLRIVSADHWKGHASDVVGYVVVLIQPDLTGILFSFRRETA